MSQLEDIGMLSWWEATRTDIIKRLVNIFRLLGIYFDWFF